MNRNELRQALEDAADTLITSTGTGLMVDQASPIWEAASAWLDLQPGENGVYKKETIERIAKAIWRSDVLDVNERRWEVLQEWQRSDYRSQAVAVLDAFNEADPK